MPSLKRDDGVEIHWEERGEGPLVVVIVHTFAYPEVLAELIDELAVDHRVVTYDARGTGESTRQGPYDAETDAGDLAALVEEAGGPAVALAWGEGGHRAVLVADERPDLIRTVVSIGGGGGVVGPAEGEGTDALVGSEAVRSAFEEMLRTDYRGALNSVVSSTSPQLSEDEVRVRVERGAEYCSPEAALARFQSWFEFDVVAPHAERLGDRLWLQTFPTIWHPREAQEVMVARLPRARIEFIEADQGPLSRPDVTVDIVKRASAELREPDAKADA